MNAAALTASQLRYVNKAYWRSPAAAFFALVYPLMFLVIFTSIFRNSDVQFGAGRVNEATFYVPGMVALAVITVCFNNIAVAVTFQRDSEVLKRIDGTPLPRAAFFGARILHAVLVSALLVVITATFGRVFYHADIPTGITLLRMLVMLAVGAAALCERRRLTANRQRDHPAAAVPVRGLHPARQQPACLDALGRPDLPGPALPVRDAGRIPRLPVRLDRRGSGGRLGPGRARRRDPLLPLGTANRLILFAGAGMTRRIRRPG
jgi:hypothetical protein